ncbi:MAG: hypothetical protein V7L14_25735 [Nostoc sp.]
MSFKPFSIIILREWGVGSGGDEGAGEASGDKGEEPIHHAPCPMPNAPCPMPHAQCPMPNAQCPMPHAPCPMPYLTSVICRV